MARRAQAWSLDLIIGVLIFMIGAGVIISLLTSKDDQDPAPLRVESEVIATKLVAEESLQVAPANQLDMATLYALAANSSEDYDTTREGLGVQNEFCIYLQDEDGNLVFIQDPNDPTQSYAGVGSSNGDLNLTNQNIPCGRPCEMQSDGTCKFS